MRPPIGNFTRAPRSRRGANRSRARAQRARGRAADALIVHFRRSELLACGRHRRRSRDHDVVILGREPHDRAGDRTPSSSRHGDDRVRRIVVGCDRGGSRRPDRMRRGHRSSVTTAMPRPQHAGAIAATTTTTRVRSVGCSRRTQPATAYANSLRTRAIARRRRRCTRRDPLARAATR